MKLDGSGQEATAGAESKDKLKQPLHLSGLRRKDYTGSNLLNGAQIDTTPVSSSENSRIEKSQRMHG